MKTRVLLIFTIAALTMLAQCSDDEKSKTIPTVVTIDVTNIETNSAMLHGEVSDDGNATITASGFVYSSAVASPTLADDKVTLTDNEDEFSAILEGLTSGTEYHVRAYATNSVGTGYGEVLNLTTGNAAPTVTNVSITDDVEVNGELIATYTYSDEEGDIESNSILKWYIANDATGTSEAVIPGATELTYIIAEAQQGKYIRFGVLPKSATGNTTGIEVKSAFVGAIGDATITFIYDGEEVTYGIINSSTGRKWLDRNLGAANAPAAVNDYANYGDLFQWGRAADGHQIVTRTGATDAQTSGVAISTISSGNDNPGNAFFIMAEGGWRNPVNDNLWQGVSGVNNPCPSGWRIPTLVEFQAESLGNIDDAFNKLKFTYTGFRFGSDGNFYATDMYAYFWTTTVFASGSYNYFGVGVSETMAFDVPSSSAMACRCIKN